MGIGSKWAVEIAEEEANNKKEQWIRNYINDDEADEYSDEWYKAEEKYEEMIAQLVMEREQEAYEEENYYDEVLDNENTQSIKRTENYTLVEYHPNNWVLENLAEEISRKVYSHFILFDHKGNIETDNQEALNVLLTKEVAGSIYIGKQMFIVDTDLLNINSHNFFQSIGYQDNKETDSTVTNPNIKIKIKSDIKPVLGVETIAETLSSIIVNQPDDSGMMIGIFGKWGRGKTYLAEKTWDFLKEEKPKYERVVFSAWKYQDTKASWAYLYETFLNTYLYDKEENKKDTLWEKTKSFLGYNKKLWKINVNKYQLFPLIGFVITLLLGFTWTFFIDKILIVKTLISIFGVVTLIQIFFFYLKYKNSVSGLYNKYFSKKSYSEHLGLQSEIENELTNLLKAWIPDSNKHEKIILFVDDIDRCNIEQVISIIDGLRVILDNPVIHERLIIITAIDENILYQALDHKYIGMKKKQVKAMHKEYLEKIFIIGLKLNHLSSNEIEEFLENILPEEENEIEDTEPIEPSISNTINLKDIKSPTQYIQSTIFERSNYEINSLERKYLKHTIKNLNYATPRKVRIFYYKYLIMKQLLHIRLEEKGLVDNWRTESDERVIADILIHTSNDLDINTFECDKGNEILAVLKDTASMVSIL